MLLDIVVGLLCAWISLKLMSRRQAIDPITKVQHKRLELEIHKPQDGIYLVYSNGDFVLQATSIEDCATKITEKFGTVSMGFINKDKEVPEKEWDLLFKSVIDKLEKR